MRVRTVTGWAEMTEDEARRALAAQAYRVGPAVIEHNAFMNHHYPLPKEQDHDQG
jgi:hypothetical protein